MADKKNNGAQNIDGVLEQLKRSYADGSGVADDVIENDGASNDMSHEDLQAMLRSQFLDDNQGSSEVATEEDDIYAISEEFLNNEFEFDDDEYSRFEIEQESEVDDEEKLYEADGKSIEEAPLEKEVDEKVQDDKEATLYQGIEQGFEQTNQDDEKIIVDEGFEAPQKEENNEASQEIYETKEPKEVHEGVQKSIQIIPKRHNYNQNDDGDYFDDEGLWNENEVLTPIPLSDNDSDDGSLFELTDDTRTDAEKAGDHYVGMFYRSNEYDPYENVPFKDRILENAPTIESLEAALDKASQENFDFDSAINSTESGVLGENVDENVDENQSDDSIVKEGELDRSDVALLLEFGYDADLLRRVSSEQATDFSNESLLEEISDDDKESNGDILEQADSDDSDKNASESQEQARQQEKKRFEKLKAKLNKQYEAYRKKRVSLLVRLIISAIFAFALFVFELIPILNDNAGGIFNRELYFVAFELVGLQILVFAAIPAIKSIYESFQRLFSARIDAYFLAGVSLIFTIIYDFVVVFQYKDVPPTFHFCAALVIVFAELSELMRLLSEMKGFEYYFMEYLFDDVGDFERFKYTLIKSEGKNSIAEKMYIGGIDEKTDIYFPQMVESAGGFFDASDVESRRNRATFGWVAASIAAAFILTIVSGIIYEKIWIAAASFIITFNLMMPITALISEWLPFYRLSKQSYAYGAAFASEGALEQIDNCDMLIFNDLHIFEPCGSNSVSLAMYDSTPKTVLLSCLNSVYSEIGGPLQLAFSSIKVQSLGECRINRVAKSGVEAFVGNGYSVLIGDEQFMSRYGITFPDATLAKLEDKMFTLCVSINNRVTARIAVKYKINDTFYNIVQKLTEDKIYCAIQTYDPMINAELIARVSPFKGAPINVVHKSSTDHALEKHAHKTSALYSVMGEDLCVLARGSRLNLAVALSNAKKLRVLRKIFNICSGTLICGGGITAMLIVLSEKLMTVSWMSVFMYWLISGVLAVVIMAWKFPQRDRFIFRKK